MKQDKSMMETLNKAFAKQGESKPKPLQEAVERWSGWGLTQQEIMEAMGISKMEYFNIVDGCEHLMGSVPQRHKLARVLLIEKVAKAFRRAYNETSSC